MELSLGRRADYAIRAVLDLARHSGQPARRKSREIGQEMAIPASYLPQILAELVRSGLISSEAGPHGGYALARAPGEISMLDVVNAMEGEPSPAECVLRGGPCRWEGMCAVHLPWSRAQQAMLAQLAATSFAELAAIDASIEAGSSLAG
jgi:Rrf2 family protein